MMENDSVNPQTESASEAKDPGRMDRIAGQTKGLIEDIKEWIDLKVQLIQIELEDRFETVANRILATLLILVMAFVTFIFALIAAALAIGNALGDPLWGFLVVTGILALATILIHIVKPKLVSAPWTREEPETPSLTSAKQTVQLPEKASTTLNQSHDGADNKET